MSVGNRSGKPKLGTFGDGVFDYDFRFLMNGTSDPDTIKGKGCASVTYTGVGAFTCNLWDSAREITSICVSVSTYDGDVMSVKHQLESDGTSGILDGVIKVVAMDDDGTPENDTAANFTWINVKMSVSLSPNNT
jgi:hypothetical protein